MSHKNAKTRQEMMKRLMLVLVIIFVGSGCQRAPDNSSLNDEPQANATLTPFMDDTLAEPSLLPTHISDNVTLGKGVLAADWHENLHWLVAVNPYSGERIDSAMPIPLGTNFFPALAPDGQTLALVTFDSTVHLHLINLSEWSDFTVELLIERPQYFSAVRYSPDGHSLALVTGDRKANLYIVNLQTFSVDASIEVDFMVRAMDFTNDSSGLMFFGMPVRQSSEITEGDPLAALYTVNELKLAWQMSFPDMKEGIYPKNETAENMHAPGAAEMFQSGLVFAPDRNMLYIARSNAQLLTAIDFDARMATTFEVKKQISWLDRLVSLTARAAYAKMMKGTIKQAVVSSDGKRLFVIGMVNEFKLKGDGEYELIQTPVNLQSIRIEDGVLLAEAPLGMHTSSWFELANSMDDEALLLMSYENGQPDTDIFDPDTLGVIINLPDFEVHPGRNLNGEPLLLGIRFGSSGRTTAMAAFTTKPVIELGAWKPTKNLIWIKY
jgi:hypothetical protein